MPKAEVACCIVEGCVRRHYRKKVCVWHHGFWSGYFSASKKRPRIDPRYLPSSFWKIAKVLPVSAEECLVAGCKAPVLSKSVCRQHYQLWQDRHRAIGVLASNAPHPANMPSGFWIHKKRGAKPFPARECLVGVCEDRAIKKGLCKKHYERFRLRLLSIDAQDRPSPASFAPEWWSDRRVKK